MPPIQSRDLRAAAAAAAPAPARAPAAPAPAAAPAAPATAAPATGAVQAATLVRQQGLTTRGHNPNSNSSTAFNLTQQHVEENNTPFLQLQALGTAPTSATGAGVFSSFVPVDPTSSEPVVWPPAKVTEQTASGAERELITGQTWDGQVLCPPAQLNQQQQGASGLGARESRTSGATWNAPIISSTTPARDQQQNQKAAARCSWVVTTDGPLRDFRRPWQGQQWQGQFGQGFWNLQGDAREAAGPAQQQLISGADICLLGTARTVTAAAQAAQTAAPPPPAPAAAAPPPPAPAATVTVAAPAAKTNSESDVGNWLDATPNHGQDQQQQRLQRRLKRQSLTCGGAGCMLAVNALDSVPVGGQGRPLKQLLQLQQTLASAAEACSQVPNVHPCEQQQQQQGEKRQQQQGQQDRNKRQQREQEQQQGGLRQQQQEQERQLNTHLLQPPPPALPPQQQQQQGVKRQVQQLQGEKRRQQWEQERQSADTHLLQPPPPAPAPAPSAPPSAPPQQQQLVQLPEEPPQSWEDFECAIDFLQLLLPVSDFTGWAGLGLQTTTESGCLAIAVVVLVRIQHLHKLVTATVRSIYFW